MVELVLRSAGIRLFTFEESQELDTSVRNAVLRCQASILYNASGTIATFVVKVDLEEGLLTVGQQVVFGRIWTSGAFGTVGKDNLRETIIDDFKVHAEKFANDYLAANPRNR